MSHVLKDLEQLFSSPENLQVARVYGADGGGAHDPRTNVRVARFKDALKGRLDRFLEGWRQRDQDAERA